MPTRNMLTLDVCPVCGLVSGQLAWWEPVVAGECAGAVCLGTAHDPTQMERGVYLRHSLDGRELSE